MVLKHPLSARRGGILCHLTSIPPGSIDRFIDFMNAAGLSLWQVLPLHPPDEHGSPYNGTSLFALDPTITELIEGHDEGFVDDDAELDGYDEFKVLNQHWLDDFVLFEIGRSRFGRNWARWPAAARDRAPDGLAELRSDEQMYEMVAARQWRADRCWSRLRRKVNAQGILLFGDMPLYPAYESADAWSRPELFLLDERRQAEFVAGVPPDYFSEAGQLWGNPIYDWAQSRAESYGWWLARLRRLLGLFDVVRIDHFRGLEAFWAIPADAKDARVGEWRKGPGHELLGVFRDALGDLPLVAEDLGIIDSAVNALRDDFELPGMKVLQFAFSGDRHNPHLPSAYVHNAVAYTGTHDNDTSEGWYASLDRETRGRVDSVIGVQGNAAWRMIETVYGSSAATAIAPLQDYLALGSGCRMNTPGTLDGNWAWRFEWDDVSESVAARIRTLAERTRRLPEKERAD
jgi:4-alpha-glucanotransferase